MVAIKDRVKIALDESRILVLLIQVLVGFNYNCYFQQGFQGLAYQAQIASLVALALLLFALALIVSPAAYHHIVESGNETSRLLDFTNSRMSWALLPLAISLGLEVYVSARPSFAEAASWTFGGIASALAFGFWFVLGLLWVQKGREERPEEPQPEKVDIKDRVNHALTEARVVLPGAGTLLGFGLLTPLTAAFADLPPSARYVHVGSLLLLTAATVLLLAPAAFHRIVEHGEATERLVAFASRMILSALALLAFGIACDVFIVVWKVLESASAALTAATGILVFCYGLWFGYTWWLRPN